jgi:RNA polymerase sigma factor (sigma-70 family)
MSFPATRLSVVERTRSDDPDVRRLAFSIIVEAYWKPAYKYLRLKWNLDPDAAQDLTQEFFAHALEKSVLEHFDPAKARFRTYLRLCLDGFASNARKAERRQKRGGGIAVVPLDFETAEGELATHEPAVRPDVEEFFYQEWVRTLLQYAIDEIQAWALSSNREVMFEVFRRYDLVEAVDERPTYAALAQELGITSTAVTNHLAAMRRRLRTAALARLRDLTTTEDEFESEAKRLFGGVR